MNTRKPLLLTSILVLLMGLTSLRPAVSRATSTLNSPTDAGNRAALQSVVPNITKATIVKKDLIVEGENFAAGAIVLFNGTKALKTRNDDVMPGAKLIVKKGRNSLPIDEVVSLQVKNPDHQVSTAFGFFTGLTLTYHNTLDGGGTLLRVGQVVLLDFDDPDIFWNILYEGGHGTTIEFISGRVPLLPAAQELFLARQPGDAVFRMVGTPVGAAPFLWLVNLTVQ